MQKKFVRAASGFLCGVMALSVFAGCGSESKKKDAIVIMTEALNGLFNPFYATTGTDMDVVGMTQIGMLSTDSNGKTVAGDDYPTVVKAYSIEEKKVGTETESVYTFVLKNGLKFSDGMPLTMNDVLFNMYEYLDPVYTGSSTMYSTKIKGLTEYRLQRKYSDGGSSAADSLSDTANTYASTRIQELIDVYMENAKIEGSTSSYSLDEEGMKNAIKDWYITDGYKMTVATPAEQEKLTDDDYKKMLTEDYEYALETFKKELESDFTAAKESFDTNNAPYKDWTNYFTDDTKGEIFRFFLYEGYITPVYHEVMGKKDKTKIDRFDGVTILDSYTTVESAINKVYKDKVISEMHYVLSAWGTAGTMKTKFSADAMDILIHSNIEGDQLAFPNIEGIVSLGHTTNVANVTIDGVTYNVAHDHASDGTPVGNDVYDVLQITIEGTDPKAIYNFGFTVAPAHYYSADSEHPNGRTIDIKNNKFGVDYSSSEFQTYTIQATEHQDIPVGAGPYKASDYNNSDTPSGESFWQNNVVYYKANEYFMFEVKTEKLQMQVVSSTNAIDKLRNNEVDYISPQFTKANAETLEGMEGAGFKTLKSWQLGYGYIGINAGKVPNINIRRAIMSAMQTSLALSYYQTGTIKNIDWPMSSVSWAYPTLDDGSSKQNGHDYTQYTTRSDAEAKIQKYMTAAGVSAGDSQLKVKFTIAGASITEHPTYAVFKQAAEILNDMGWEVEVKADSQALTKLSTGSLEVWAAAWGSTIDPDMYQVYHKNSSATSVYAWGYREIKADKSTYAEENTIINKLSELIDEGRSITDQDARTVIYENAMSLVLDLAVELPVYQRMNLYAYNSNTIKGINSNVNPYSSPLEKIWELELV